MRLKVREFPDDVESVPHADLGYVVDNGDLLLCAGSGVVSKMIQRASRSVWSHVGLLVWVYNRLMLLESCEPQGVRATPLSHYYNDYNGSGEPYPGRAVIARHSFVANEYTDNIAQMWGWAADQLSHPYDKDELLRIAARICGGFFGYTSAQMVRDDEYICSEYVWECYKRAGIDIAYDPRGFIAPKDFARDPKVSLVARIL